MCGSNYFIIAILVSNSGIYSVFLFAISSKSSNFAVENET